MTNGQQSYDAKGNVRAARILLIGMIAGVVMFAGIVAGLHTVGGLDAMIEVKTEISRGIVAAVALLCLLAALSIYRKSTAAAKNLTGSLNDKLNYHRSFFIRYLAVCDFAALFSVIGFFLTGDFLLLIITAVMVLAMLYVNPTKDRLVNDLGLDWNEQAQL